MKLTPAQIREAGDACATLYKLQYPTPPIYGIKVRIKEAKRFRFISNAGKTTCLRVHARRYTEEAATNAVKDDYEPLFPQHEWKVVKL